MADDYEAMNEAFEKGIKLGPTINKDRYICPTTGAHFEFNDMSRRIKKADKGRFKDERFKHIDPPEQKIDKNFHNRQVDVHHIIDQQKAKSKDRNILPPNIKLASDSQENIQKNRSIQGKSVAGPLVVTQITEPDE